MTTATSTDSSPAREVVGYLGGMHFGVLGPVEASEAKQRLTVGGPKQRTVLALLLAHAGNPVSTDTLVDGVYGYEAPDGARRSVQTYISNLRSELGGVIEATGSGYLLRVGRTQVDALRFEDAVSEATGFDDPDRTSEVLRDALGMWRGHPYADVDGLFEITTERARLSELRLSAIELRVDADLERGHHRQLIAELDSLTEEHPLRERFRAQHMLALYRCGRQAEALRAYDKTRTYLVDETGLDPSPELSDLEQRILDQDPTLRFQTGPTVKPASILVADIADPVMLVTLRPVARDSVITSQSEAIRQAAAQHGGDLFAHRGSAMYLSFDRVEDAVGTAIATQQVLAAVDATMRMAISVGDVESTSDDTVQGPPVTRAAQLTAMAHGGQVLLSAEANQALAESATPGQVIRSLGQHAVDGSGERAVYQLIIDDLEHDFPPLRTESLPLPLPIATRGLPGYELRDEVGSGAFGTVHRAYQPSVGREVAIKLIKAEYANNPHFIRRFEVEAQLVARLEHPHIVPLHDYWRNPDGAFLVMRWLGGGSLKDAISNGSMTVDEVHRLLSNIGPALAFAHRHGVVHRDIKASNVLLDEDGDAYLTDFGIASNVSLDPERSIARDVQALAVVLTQCFGDIDEPAVADFLTTASSSTAFPDVRSFIAAWEHAVGAQDTTSQAVAYTSTRNPYKGLTAFGELDAADFHGRQQETDDIVAALAEHRLVTVVGPSGIGKSSVVRAGMIPALRTGAIPGSEQWLITDMLPGSYPHEELASALIRIVTEIPNDLEEDLRRDPRGLARAINRYVPRNETVLLIVDQFEEIFTLTSENERTAFLAMLAATVSDERSNIRIILTMRADYFDRPLRFADLGDALRAGTIPISAPNTDDLCTIVTEPAASVGVTFEPGLVEHIVSDVKQQPGALPLLEFALTELFDQRDTDQLTRVAYDTSGGVLGALGRRAETIYTNLDTTGQNVTRDTFLRLVNVTETGRDTRRRVKLSELERLGFDNQALRNVLNAYGDHRLLTFDRDATTRTPTVEVAHEAILTEWPRLTTWIDEHREDLLLHTRLAAATADWEQADRNDTYLLTTGRLNQHETWTATTDLTLTNTEHEYLTTSRDAENQRRTKRRRTRRRITTGFGIAALIAISLATAAIIARNDATARASEVESEKEIAESRALAAAAVGVLDEDPELSLLLSLRATQAAKLDFEGRQALRASMAQHKTIRSFPWTYSYMWMVWTATSPDGNLTSFNGSHEEVEVWDIGSREPTLLWTLALDPGYSSIASFTTDGTQLAIAIGWQGFLDADLPPVPPDPSLIQGIHLYDARTGEFIRQLVSTSDACSSERGPEQRYNDLTRIEVDGAWFERGECVDREGRFWWLIDPETGAMTTDPEPIDEAVLEMNITKNGWLYQVYPDRMTLLNVSTGDERTVFGDSFGWPFVSPNASFITTTESILDAETGQERWRFVDNGLDLDEWLPPCFPEQTNDAETLIFITCSDGSATVHDAYTGRLIVSLDGHTGWVSSSSDATGDVFVTGSADGTSRLWDIARPRGLDSYDPAQGYYADSSLNVVGNRATVLVYPDEVSSPFDAGVSVMNRVSPATAVVFALDTGDELARIPNAAGKATRLSPNGTKLAVQSIEGSNENLGSVWVHSVDSPERKTEMQGNCEWRPEAFFFQDDASDECPFDGLPFAADVTDLAWSPDGTLLAATAGRSRRVVVWNSTTGTVEFLTDRLGVWPFSSIQFSPDGSLLAASSKTGMWVFDTTDWSEVAMVTHPGRPSWAMRFTPDGSEIVTAQAHRGVLRIYDTSTWEERDISTGRGQSRDMAISKSGRLVALANNIGLVHIIDIETEEIIETYTLPNTDITNVEFINNDRYLLVTDAFGPVDVLTLDTEELIAEARTRLSRTFTDAECATYNLDPCPTLDDLRAG